MSSLPTRTATFASLKCRSKWDFWDKLRKSQKKGKRAVFPYDKASSRKPCLSLSSSIVSQIIHCRTQHNRAFFPSSFPIKLQQPNHHRKQKTASKFSLLLLPSFCALHFDLLFDRPDFFQSQFDEQFRILSISGYPTS